MDTKNYDIAGKKYHEPSIAKLKELYDEVFLDDIVCTESMETGKKYYHSRLFNCQTLELANRLMEPYRGGMVGVQEGLTGERYAIVMLETVYRLEKRLLPKLVEKLEPEIKECVSQQVEETGVPEAIREEKDNMLKYFTHHLETDFEELSGTDRMVPRTYLEDVCERTKAYFPDEGVNFGKCFPELEGRYSDDEWKRDKLALAVVKYAAWELMISHLHWNDTEEDNG